MQGFLCQEHDPGGRPGPVWNHDHHGLNFSLDGYGVLASEIGYRQEESSIRQAEPATTNKEGPAVAPVPAGGIKTLLEGDLPALYRIGIYNSFADYLDARHGRDVHGNYLVYALVNQSVFREAHAGPGLSQGLDAFGGVDYSPDNVSLAYLQVTGGLRYTGLLPTRGQDTLGLGVAYTEFSHRFNTPGSLLANSRYTSETALEVNYIYGTTQLLSVQPFAQYYLNPGGTGRHEDALLLGFGSKVVF